MDTPPPAPGPPDWVHGTWLTLLRQAVSMSRTLWSLARHPRVFGREWSSGDRMAPNPLGVLTTCVTIATIARALLNLGLAHLGVTLGRPSNGLIAAVLDSIGPVIYAVALGLIMHLSLVAFGRARMGWRISLGLTMYAASASLIMLAVCMVLGAPVIAFIPHTLPASIAVIATASMTVFGYTLGGSLKTAHTCPRGFISVPYLLALVLTGLVFTWLHPPGFYGLHFDFSHGMTVAW